MEPEPAVPFTTPARRPGLETLRAVATLLVVVLHAGVPYTVAPMPGLTWPVRHTAVSPLVDLVFWGIEGAIMPLFFVLSGYGAAHSLASKPEQFLAVRGRRLGWPLLAAATVILPIELYVWLIGWAADGQIPWQKLRSLKLGSFHDDLWGLSHLWYLEYLLIYSAMLWAASRWLHHGQSMFPGRSLFPAVDVSHSMFSSPRPRLGGEGTKQEYATLQRAPRARFDGVVRHWMLLGLTAATLWLAPEVIVGFQHSFWPVPAKFVFSGIFFAWGVAEFRRPSRVVLPPVSAAFAGGCLLIGLLPWLHRQVAQPLVGLERLAFALGLTAYVWLVTCAAWQWAVGSQRATSPRLARVASASFWIYLVHHPLVAICQIGLRSTGWPALLQFAGVTLGTLTGAMISYEWFVCRTWLGAFLEGRPLVAPVAATDSVSPQPVPTRRAA